MGWRGADWAVRREACGRGCPGSRVWLLAKVSIQGLESVHSPLIMHTLDRESERREEESTEGKFILFLAIFKKLPTENHRK